MLGKIVNIGISLSLVASLASCSKLSQIEDSVPQQEVAQQQTFVSSTDLNLSAKLEQQLRAEYPIAQISEDGPINVTKVEKIEANEMSIKINADKTIEANDFTPDEIDNMVQTENYPFLLENEDPAFKTQGIFTKIKDAIMKPINYIKDKIKAWKQKSAMKQLDKYQKFEEKNPAFSKELIAASKLTGKERSAKLKEIKAKYPNDYKGIKNRIAVYRWMKLEKKYPGLADDIMNLSQVPADQREAKLAELKQKYPKFFKV
ncbi:MAG: hypothetical protein U0457_17315 [Candidatus Sericytochromatia bacterium]